MTNFAKLSLEDFLAALGSDAPTPGGGTAAAAAGAMGASLAEMVARLTLSKEKYAASHDAMALNAPFQGTAADVIKVAMVRLDAALPKAGLSAKVVLQVHDELVMEVPEDEVEEVSRVVREEMEGAASLKVRLSVDVGSGRNWLEAK